jgi:hypothetical protein
MEKCPKSLKKIARELLATTCLTAVAGGTAFATTVNESTDFGNTFANTTQLPVGSDVVNGSINFTSDPADFIRFIGLAPNLPFTLSGFNVFGTNNKTVLSSSNSVIAGPTDVSLPLSGTVPGDGILIVDVNNNIEGGTYSLTLNAALAPEPSTLTGVGLALAAALGLRCRQKR